MYCIMDCLCSNKEFVNSQVQLASLLKNRAFRTINRAPGVEIGRVFEVVSPLIQAASRFISGQSQSRLLPDEKSFA